jgi:hypothetical protein
MPIESPQLDDLRYDRVVEELLRRIPVYAPEWTNWNESDPGVTMIQLFAYLAEQVGWRLNRVPEKTHIELLKLLGVRLEPARAANSLVAFFLADPAAHPGFVIPAGSRVTRRGAPPAIYETDVVHDLVPAEPRVLVVTRNPLLWDLRLRTDGATDPEPPDEKPTPDIGKDWMVVAWDGTRPPAADMPVAPIDLFPRSRSNQPLPYLWVGLDFNARRDAGFLGVQVSLQIQLDDDEVPDLGAEVTCAPVSAAGEDAPGPIDWLAFTDGDCGTPRAIPGRIVDFTARLTRSGAIRFTVPADLGPIPPACYQNLRNAKAAPAAPDVCGAIATSLVAHVPVPPPPPPVGPPVPPLWDPLGYSKALLDAVKAATEAADTVLPAIPHPLDARFRDPDKVKGWLRIGPIDDGVARRLRHIGFNVVPITHAETVVGELLGRGDGRPGQTFRLGHGNVFADSIDVAVAESSDPAAPLTTWQRVETLDAAGPFDRVFELDRESGVLLFGDGRRGRILPLIPRTGSVVALRYRHGGGIAGEAAVGAITTSAVQVIGLAGVVNIVAARGGADAETVEQAKLRARKEISTRSRAVTATDFEWIALRTPDVRVARAIVVPRRRPLPAATAGKPKSPVLATPPAPPVGTPGVLCLPCGGATPIAVPSSALAATPAPGALATCGPPLPDPPAGLDDAFEAPGVVAVVVVPDEPGPEPVPVPSFLRAVCRQLDRHRLVTTEVHVVPPQYCRLCEFDIAVKARPGYARLQIQELVTRHLATYLHVLSGGPDGTGFAFGGQVHIADLVAQVFRTEGVDRVESLRCRFARTKSNATPRTGALVLCPTSTDEHDRVDLGAEETVSFDGTSLRLSTV